MLPFYGGPSHVWGLGGPSKPLVSELRFWFEAISPIVPCPTTSRPELAPSTEATRPREMYGKTGKGAQLLQTRRTGLFCMPCKIPGSISLASAALILESSPTNCSESIPLSMVRISMIRLVTGNSFRLQTRASLLRGWVRRSKHLWLVGEPHNGTGEI